MDRIKVFGLGGKGQGHHRRGRGQPEFAVKASVISAVKHTDKNAAFTHEFMKILKIA